MHRLAFVASLIVLPFAIACADDAERSSASGTGGTGGAGGEAGQGGMGGGGGAEDPRFAPLVAAIEAERLQLGAPGVAVAVIEDGQVTFARGFGSKDPDSDVPVEPTTLFRIGSVTKMLTTAALLQDVAAGTVDLEAPVTDYIPELDFSMDPSWAPSIQVKHLLTHASAMYDYLEIDTPPDEQTDTALDTFLTGAFGGIDYLMAPSGAFFNYSNPNFYLAGLIAERSAGVPYRTAVKQRVFEPLGMSRTFFLPSEVLADGDYALGLSSYSGLPRVIRPDSYDNGWARPAGYASSSVLDLARFATFLMKGDEAVLPKALSDGMQSPQIDTQFFFDIVQYGHALFVQGGAFLGSPDAYYSMKIVQHGGDIPGFAADLEYIPSLKLGMVALSNADGAHFVRSWVTAIQTLGALPDKSTPPDLTIDPATFAPYAGTYNDPFLVGDVTVTLDGTDLRIDAPGLTALGVTYDPVLQPQAGGTFNFIINGTPLQVTFIADDTGVIRYVRTRPLVAARVDGLPLHAAPPPPDPARRKRFLDALRTPEPRVSLFLSGG